MIRNQAGNTQELARQLPDLLDQEIELLHRRRGQLASLSQAILHRDDDLMDNLLQQMEQTQADQSATDMRLARLRDALADALCLSRTDLKLSALAVHLDAMTRQAVEIRRHQIVVLADDVRKQHFQTVLLLSEAARINRLMVETLLGSSPAVTTYDLSGSEDWHACGGLVDTES